MMPNSRRGNFALLELLGSRIAGSHDILRNSATSMTLRVCGLALAFLSQILLSRTLGAAHYGSYVIALGWAMVLAIPSRLGLDNAALRFATIYREQREEAKLHGLIRFSLLTIVAISLLVSAILLTAKLAGAKPLRSIDLLLLAGVACLVLPQALLGWLSALVRTANRIFDSQFYEQVLRPSLLIAAVLLVSLLLQLSAALAMLLTVATVALALLGIGLRAAILFRPAGDSRLDFSEWRLWLSVSWVLFLMGAVQELLNQIEVILLGALANATAAAHFAAAWRLASLVPFGLVAIVTVSGPLIASAYGRGDRDEMVRIARLNARFSTAFALAVTIMLAALGKFALGLFGPGFDTAYPALLILLVGGMVNAFTGSAGYFLVLTGHQRVALLILVAALGVSVTLNMLLISRLGAIGSAIASASALSFWNVAMSIHVRRRIGIDPTALAVPPRLGFEG